MTGKRYHRLGMALAVSALVAGCGLFDDEERLSGERINIRNQQADGSGSAVSGGGAAIPAPVSNPNWTQTNAQSSHASGHLAGPSTLNRVWTADAGSGGSSEAAITSAPIVVNGRVFALDAEATVTAIDASSGSVAWRADLAPEGESGEDGFGGGLASDGTRIFATTGFGEVLSLDPASGEISWRYRASAPFRAAPAVGNGLVIAVTRSNRGVALTTGGGQLAWRLDGISASAGLLGGASPAISGGLAVLPFASGEVMGVDNSSGRRIWSAVLGGARRGLARSSISDVTGDPVIAGRVVIAANQSGRMVAIDGQTGRRGWTRSVGAVGPIWAAGDSAYVVSDDATVQRLSLGTGTTIWRTELPAFEDPEDREDPIAYSGAVLAGGKVLVTDTLGTLHSFDPTTGAPGETADLTAGTTTGAVLASGTLFVLSGDGSLQAFR
ncbi:MAG: PQQ-binding-like beta-propeller repeat protein [Pseudomonadota bacterium]